MVFGEVSATQRVPHEWRQVLVRTDVGHQEVHARRTTRMAGVGNMSRHDMSSVSRAVSPVEIVSVASAWRAAPCKGGSDAPVALDECKW